MKTHSSEAASDLFRIKAQVLDASPLVADWRSFSSHCHERCSGQNFCPGLEIVSAELFVNHLAELSKPQIKNRFVHTCWKNKKLSKSNGCNNKTNNLIKSGPKI